MILGENIRKYRRLANLTQKDLANMLGCAEITIRQYETGKREPKHETIEKIAKELKVGTSTLYGFDLEKIMKSIEKANQEARQIEKAEAIIKKLEADTTSMLDIAILQDFQKLNTLGKEEAAKRVQELTEIPRYTEPDK